MLEGAELEKALEHDEARKVAEAQTPQAADSPQAAVMTWEGMVQSMEQKQVMVAKAVSISLLDIARRYLEAAGPDNDKGNAASYTMRCLDVAAAAIKQADAADLLADKVLSSVGTSTGVESAEKAK